MKVKKIAAAFMAATMLTAVASVTDMPSVMMDVPVSAEEAGQYKPGDTFMLLLADGELTLVDEYPRHDVVYYCTVQDDGTLRLSIEFWNFEETLDVLEVPSEILGYSVTSLSATSYGDGILACNTIKIPASIKCFGEENTNSYYVGGLVQAIEVDSSNPYFKSVDGVLYSKDGKTLLSYPHHKEGDVFEVPEFVSAIADNAFCAYDRPSTIKIPESVTSIGKSNTRLDDQPYNIEGVPGSCAEEFAIINDCTFNGKKPDRVPGVYYAGETFYVTMNIEGGEVTSEPIYYADDEELKDNFYYSCAVMEDKSINVSLTLWGEDLTTEKKLEIPSEIGGCTVTGVNIVGKVIFPVIKIPATVSNVEMGSNSCGTCTLEFEVDPDNQYYQAIDGVLYSKDGKTIVSYPTIRDDETYEIPSTVTTIGTGAFQYGKNLTYIKIPEGVTDIDKEAFFSCDSLSEIELPSTLKTIGAGAFSSAAFTEIELPTGLETIGDRAFISNENLSSIKIPEGVTSIGRSVFAYTSFSEIELPSTLKSIGAEAFNSNNNLKYIKIPESVTEIGKNLFGELYDIAPATFSIEGVSGSYAEEYANKNGFTFIGADSENVSDTTAADTETVTDTSAETDAVAVDQKDNPKTASTGFPTAAIVAVVAVALVGTIIFINCKKKK